ncbi:MAG: ribbon-helix-helix domain-containing protein [Tepidiformaceae bacterium]
MRQKTSVYLDPEQVAKLKRISRRTHRPPAEIVREAIDAMPEPDREFAIFGSHEGDGTSIADVPRKERLKGFGER